MSAALDLRALIRGSAWMADGLCVEYAGTVNFFPERYESSRPAQDVCARCSVRDECLSYALEYDIRAGV